MTRPDRAPVRAYLPGHAAILAALAAGEPVRIVLVGAHDDSPETTALCAAAEAAGAKIWRGGDGDLRRMSRSAEPPAAMAMLGPDPVADLDQTLQRGGVTWLLHRASYPSNAGFAIRTAEVSGADGIVIDAQWNHDERGRVRHVSMGASMLLPVLYRDSGLVFERAKAHGVRVVAIEDVGAREPWQVDLRGPVLCVIGNERHGVDADLLKHCDDIVRIPMSGFVPSYNLQAAMAAIAVERLRQLSTGVAAVTD